MSSHQHSSSSALRERQTPGRTTQTQLPPQYDPPTIDEYINNRIDRDVSEQDYRGEQCVICQHVLGTNEGPTTSFNNANSSVPPVFRMPPCNHMFHALCILEWLMGSTPNRNQCPICRTEMCQTGVPSPESVAHIQTMYTRLDRLPFWHEAHFIAILTFVDGQFALQGEGDAARFVTIPRIVADWWAAQGGAHVSWEHRHARGRWVEYIAARRVYVLILDARVEHTWPGIQLVSLFNGIHREYNRLYDASQPATQADGGDSPQSSNGSSEATVLDGEVQAAAVHGASLRTWDMGLHNANQTPPHPPAEWTFIQNGEARISISRAAMLSVLNSRPNIAAGRTVSDNQIVVEIADEQAIVHNAYALPQELSPFPTLRFMPADWQDYPDTDSPGSSDDDCSTEIPALYDVPDLFQSSFETQASFESQNSAPHGMLATLEQLDFQRSVRGSPPGGRDGMVSGVDGHSLPRKKQKRKQEKEDDDESLTDDQVEPELRKEYVKKKPVRKMEGEE